MPKVLMIDAKWNDKIELDKSLKKILIDRNVKSLALFTSVQFLKLGALVKELEKMKIQIRTTKAKRADSPVQILGCDCYSDSYLEGIIEASDVVLYIGDGMFHPKALLLSQQKSKQKKPLILFDPITRRVSELNESEIVRQINRYERNLKMYLNSKKIGILVTTKPGQQYFQLAKKLKEKLREEGKDAWIFLDNTFDFGGLENYPFIDCWVNSACPRIGTDDIISINRPLINIKEAFEPTKFL